jgi:tRNA nucleotidyltransferase/poly(A) polymerase
METLSLGQLHADWPELQQLAEALATQNISLWLVGGPVRDLLCGLTPNDLDVTSAATPEAFRAVISKHLSSQRMSVFDVGEAHGTTGVRFVRADGTEVDVEHTTHRRESYEPGSRTPLVVFGTELAEDLARRDFTLNSIALNLLTGELSDPFNGVADLAAGVLRCAEDPMRTFDEDPLRILRAVRFAGVRGWKISEDTAEAAQRQRGRLSIVSVERCRAEMGKIIAAGPEALATSLDISVELGVSSSLFGLSTVAASESAAALRQVQPGQFAGLEQETLRCLLAVSSSDVTTWADGFRFPNAVVKQVRSVAKFQPELSTLETRRALRCEGSVAAQVALNLAVVLNSSPSQAVQLAQAISDAEHICSPLPVSGQDAIAAGHSGQDVGRVLRDVEDAFLCSALTRDQALTLLQR